MPETGLGIGLPMEAVSPKEGRDLRPKNEVQTMAKDLINKVIIPAVTPEDPTLLSGSIFSETWQDQERFKNIDDEEALHALARKKSAVEGAVKAHLQLGKKAEAKLELENGVLKYAWVDDDGSVHADEVQIFPALLMACEEAGDTEATEFLTIHLDVVYEGQRMPHSQYFEQHVLPMAAKLAKVAGVEEFNALDEGTRMAKIALAEQELGGETEYKLVYGEAPGAAEGAAKKAPEKTKEELKVEIGEANGQIAEKAKTFTEYINKSAREAAQTQTQLQENIQKLLRKFEPVCQAYGLALQNPAKDASEVFLKLSAGLKWKFLGNKEKAPTEEELKSNFIKAVLEVESNPKVTEGGLTQDQTREIEEALNGLDSSKVASVIQAAISNKEVVDLAKEFGESEELKDQYEKVVEIFKDEKFRKEFCRRLFGKENLSEEDLSKSFKDATGLDLETKRGSSLLGAAILIFYLYYFIKQQVDDLTAGVVGGGQGGQTQ